jgi:hypothetical protein
MRRFPAVLLLGAALATPVGWGVEATSPAAAPAKPAKKAAAENPRDWHGVWELDYQRAGLAATRAAGAQPKLTPEYQAKLDAYKA